MLPDPRHDALSRSAFGSLPEPELARLAGEVRESRLRAGHLLYDPEVTVIATGLIRAFIADDTGRQVTVSYLRPGSTLGLAYLAGRHYPTAFQAVEDSQLVIVGNDRAQQLHQTHAALGWATAQELVGLLDGLETALAYFAFGQLRQRLAYHLLALTAETGEAPPVHLARLANAVGSSREMVSRTLDAGCSAAAGVAFAGRGVRVDRSVAEPVGEAGLSWVAADWAVLVAQQTADSELVTLGIYRLAQALLRAGEVDDAHRVATAAAAYPGVPPSVPASGLSLQGALLLTGALAAARGGDGRESLLLLRKASRVADAVGEDRNDLIGRLYRSCEPTTCLQKWPANRYFAS